MIYLQFVYTVCSHQCRANVAITNVLWVWVDNGSGNLDFSGFWVNFSEFIDQAKNLDDPHL